MDVDRNAYTLHTKEGTKDTHSFMITLTRKGQMVANEKEHIMVKSSLKSRRKSPNGMVPGKKKKNYHQSLAQSHI